MRVGADPELMLLDPAGGLVSAIGVVPGTKVKPEPVECGAVQHDNVMAEFNIDPADSSEELEHNMRTVLGGLAKIVSPNRLTVRAYAKYPEKELDHREAKKFGCDPDFSAWPNEDGILTMNSVDGSKAFEPYRSAGGHWHVGHKPDTQEMLSNGYGKIEIVKMLDVFMGIPSVLLDNDATSNERRSLYGKAGSHRPKDYGVEYRALGNFWVASPSHVALMYELCDLAVKLTLDQKSEGVLESLGQPAIVDCINKSDAKSASKLLTGPLSKYLSAEQMQAVHTDTPPLDLYKTWSLN